MTSTRPPWRRPTSRTSPWCCWWGSTAPARPPSSGRRPPPPPRCLRPSFSSGRRRNRARPRSGNAGRRPARLAARSLILPRLMPGAFLLRDKRPATRSQPARGAGSARPAGRRLTAPQRGAAGLAAGCCRRAGVGGRRPASFPRSGAYPGAPQAVSRVGAAPGSVTWSAGRLPASRSRILSRFHVLLRKCNLLVYFLLAFLFSFFLFLISKLFQPAWLHRPSQTI